MNNCLPALSMSNLRKEQDLEALYLCHSCGVTHGRSSGSYWSLRTPAVFVACG